MKGWTWKDWGLLVLGLALAGGAGIMLFLRYYPQYSPDYLAWKKENPEAPYIDYQAKVKEKETGRKNSDGGGKGSSLSGGSNLNIDAWKEHN